MYIKLFYRFKRGVQCRDQIARGFDADGKADRVGLDPLIQQLFPGKLGMGGAGRMDHEGFYVGDVGEQREEDVRQL